VMKMRMRMKEGERIVWMVVEIQEEVQGFWMVVLGHSLLLKMMEKEMEVMEVKKEIQMLCFFPIQGIPLSLIVSLNQIEIETEGFEMD